MQIEITCAGIDLSALRMWGLYSTPTQTLLNSKMHENCPIHRKKANKSLFDLIEAIKKANCLYWPSALRLIVMYSAHLPFRASAPTPHDQ